VPKLSVLMRDDSATRHSASFNSARERGRSFIVPKLSPAIRDDFATCHTASCDSATVDADETLRACPDPPPHPPPARISSKSPNSMAGKQLEAPKLMAAKQSEAWPPSAGLPLDGALHSVRSKSLGSIVPSAVPGTAPGVYLYV
jgi:hypothetical protein